MMNIEVEDEQDEVVAEVDVGEEKVVDMVDGKTIREISIVYIMDTMDLMDVKFLKVQPMKVFQQQVHNNINQQEKQKQHLLNRNFGI